MPKTSKKNIKKRCEAPKTREMEYKGDLQEYGKVVSLLGDRRITIMLPDRTETMGIIGGGLKRKRVYIAVDDVVIASRRDFQEGKLDIIYKYTPDEVKKLIQYQELPGWFDKSSAMIADEGVGKPSDDLGFTFVTEDEDEETGIDFDDI
jgi:translation initiation factor 1A